MKAVQIISIMNIDLVKSRRLCLLLGILKHQKVVSIDSRITPGNINKILKVADFVCIVLSILNCYSFLSFTHVSDQICTIPDFTIWGDC